MKHLGKYVVLPSRSFYFRVLFKRTNIKTGERERARVIDRQTENEIKKKREKEIEQGEREREKEREGTRNKILSLPRE